MTLSLNAVDDLFAARFAEGRTPGLVYGVVHHGELVHSGGLGVASTHSANVADARPDEHTVMRIASMTKSFTAAAVLLLRDRGLLDLDEAVAQYLPELVDQAPYSTSSPAVTLRMLLTMATGLPSDNPWGDRQESLTYEQFGTFLDGGFIAAGEAGVRFEYSNLGYALLGRVIDNVVGADAPDGAGLDFVEYELLAPLGLTSTRYDAAQCGPRLAPGHVRRGDAWVELPSTGPGAFSPIGGLHSTVADLALWVGGMTAAYADKVDAHPLSKATRRELQQLYRFGRVSATLSTEGPGAVAFGYGYGLMVDHDDRLGQIVHHAGGYPGYGSRMAWHPGTGLGVVTMSNGAYGAAGPTCMEALRVLVRAERRPRRVPDLVAPEVERVTAYVLGFDPAGAATFADPVRFADNVELDVPDAERRRQLAEARATVGAPVGGPSEPRSEGLAHAAWTVPAERGRYDMFVLLSPEATPRWQEVGVTAVPTADPAVLERARAALAAGTPQAVLMRAFGEPVLLDAPVSVAERSTELLLGAGETWWKVIVPTPEGEVELVPHETAAYPRVAWLAGQLRATRYPQEG